jgi:ribonuclease P/MRP protein subunit POP1
LWNFNFFLIFILGTTGIPSIKGLAFQHVPKHMRRRAVSHNPKRLPKRLQAIHKSQMEKCSGQSSSKKPKKPSRKYRRRPSNLLQEYNRRQREHKWLETHIWHAKRYIMNNFKIHLINF